MRVFIVENDRALGAFLNKGLTAEGHQTTCFDHASLLLQRCQQEQPHLIVLGARTQDELEVAWLRKVRVLSPDAAILVLAETAAMQDKVKCLDLGADDCLTKPFNFLELVARCRALLRRLTRKVPTVRHVAGLDVDLLQRRVRCEGKEFSLTTTEFALFETLLRKDGECCSREELLREVWADTENISPNVVDVYINYLRKKLGSISGCLGRSQIIETVRGSGYRLRFRANHPSTEISFAA